MIKNVEEAADAIIAVHSSHERSCRDVLSQEWFDGADIEDWIELIDVLLVRKRDQMAQYLERP